MPKNIIKVTCRPIIVVFDGKHGVFLQCGLKGWLAAKEPRLNPFYTAVDA
jgi:hypothetical protein